MNDNTFNFAVGVLALASAAASILGYIHSRLPSEQMETFDNILNRSKILFAIAKEDGLITGPLQKAINAKIKRLETSSLGARARAYGPSQGLGLFMMHRGLLKDIEILMEEAKELRLFIAVSVAFAYGLRMTHTFVQTSAQHQQQLQSHWGEGAADAEPGDRRRSVASWWQPWVCARRWRAKAPVRTGPRFPA